MHYRWLIVGLALLSGCGGSSGGSNDAGPTEGEAISTPTPAPTMAPAAFRLDAAADATLYESVSGDLASGRGGSLFAGVTRSGDLRRFVLRFDLASVPEGMPSLAELDMHVTKLRFSENKRFTIHRLLESWTEGPADAGTSRAGGGAAAEDGDVTWIHRSFDTSTWGVAGGVFAAEPSAEAFVSEVGPVVFSSLSNGLEQDIQLWRSDVSRNFGWIILGPEDDAASAVEWASRENNAVDQQPKLRLEY